METHHDVPTITCYPSSFSSLDVVTPENLDDSRGAVYLMNADGTIPPPELETRAKVLWNASFLFVVFQGKFQELRTARSLPVDPQTGESYFLWEHSDVYEAFIGPNARLVRKYKEFQVAPDGRWVDLDVFKDGDVVKANDRWLSGFRCRSFVSETSKTWGAVLEIPWKTFAAGVDTTCEWNCNFFRATGRFHGDELLAWSPTGIGKQVFHQPEKFGRMVFQR